MLESVCTGIVVSIIVLFEILEFENMKLYNCETSECLNVGTLIFEMLELWFFEMLERCHFEIAGTLEFLNLEVNHFEIVEKMGPEKHEDPSNYVCKSWIWDQYYPENTKWTFGNETKKLRNFEIFRIHDTYYI